MKVKFISSLVGGEQDYHIDGLADFETEKALRLIDAGICIPTSKKAYDDAVEKSIAEKKEQLEKEKKAAAILYKDELLGEKQNLLSRVDEINKDLEIEDMIITKAEYENLVGFSEMVAVPKDKFISLIENTEMINIQKTEYEKLTVVEEEESKGGDK